MARTRVSGLVSGCFSKLLMSSLALGSVVALSSCGSGGGGGGGERVVPPDFNSCDQKPDTGAAAIAANSTQTQWVPSEFFAKPYDRFDLEAVLDASSVSTTDYVRSLGVNLNRIPRESLKNACPTYYNLPAADKTLSAIWSEAAGGSTGNGKLAGLFFELCGDGGFPSCKDREVVNPTILVDEASDRWTLVHEMMHYNFNQARKAATDLPTDSWLKRATKGYAADMKTAFKAYQDMPNRDDLSLAVKNFRGLVEVGKETYVRHALEEMTIEGMLINRWADGKFKNVSAKAPESGVWYMGYSRDQFIPSLPPLEEVADILKKAADDNFWPEISADVAKISEMINNSRLETKAMIETAKARIQAKQNSNGENQFSESSLSAYLAGEEFNIVNFEASIRAHLAGHDELHLQESFNQVATDLAESLR